MLPSDSRLDPPQPPPTTQAINPFDTILSQPTTTTTSTTITTTTTTTTLAGVSSAPSSLVSSGTPSLISTMSDGASSVPFPAVDNIINTTPAYVPPSSPKRNSLPPSIPTTSANSSPMPNRQLDSVTATPVSSVTSRVPMDAVLPALAPVPSETDGVLLGLQQLEWQQAELERRRNAQQQQQSLPTSTTSSPLAPSRSISAHSTPQAPRVVVTTVPTRTNTLRNTSDHFVDDDENTEPSSTEAFSENRDGGLTGVENPVAEDNASTFTRFIQTTKRRLGSGSQDRQRRDGVELEEEADVPEGALIAGYLLKLGRNGKWQKRWFETDGESLSYYKSHQRVKLLATLDLEKVGKIAVNNGDASGCSFSIQVSGRPYHLRAESKASCKDWVITLNRVKEAHLQQGNVKLITYPAPRDFLDRTESDEYAARVVVVANRQRTRAVDEMNFQSWEQEVGVGPMPATQNESRLSTRPTLDLSNSAHLTQVVFASWKKKRSTFTKMASKLLRWARSLRTLSCTDSDEEPVFLDQHVHPPGHDSFVRDRSTLPSGARKVQTRPWPPTQPSTFPATTPVDRVEPPPPAAPISSPSTDITELA